MTNQCSSCGVVCEKECKRCVMIERLRISANDSRVDYCFPGNETRDLLRDAADMLAMDSQNKTPVAYTTQPTSGDYAMGYAEGFNDACKPVGQHIPETNHIEIDTTMREEFEQQIRQYTHSEAGEKYALRQDENGHYLTMWVADRWAGWQAAMIMPELPHHPEPHTYTWTNLEKAAIHEYGEKCFAAGASQPEQSAAMPDFDRYALQHDDRSVSIKKTIGGDYCLLSDVVAAWPKGLYERW